MQKNYTSLGLMSGTSGDGVDASIIVSNGIDHFDIVKNTVISYIYEIVLKKQIALGMSLLTVENYDQALKRSSAKEKINSGFNAAMVCSKMIEILKKDEKF